MEHKKRSPRIPKIQKIREDKISGKTLYFFLTGQFQNLDESKLVDLSLQNFHGWLGLGRVSHIYLGEKKDWDGNYKIMLVECFKEVKGKKLKELKNEMKVSEDFIIEICAVKPFYNFKQKPIVEFRIDFENTSCFEVKYNFEVTRIASASQVKSYLVLRIRNLLFRRIMEKNYQKAEMPWRKRRMD